MLLKAPGIEGSITYSISINFTMIPQNDFKRFNIELFIIDNKNLKQLLLLVFKINFVIIDRQDRIRYFVCFIASKANLIFVVKGPWFECQHGVVQID